MLGREPLKIPKAVLKCNNFLLLYGTLKTIIKYKFPLPVTDLGSILVNLHQKIHWARCHYFNPLVPREHKSARIAKITILKLEGTIKNFGIFLVNRHLKKGIFLNIYFLWCRLKMWNPFLAVGIGKQILAESKI